MGRISNLDVLCGEGNLRALTGETTHAQDLPESELIHQLSEGGIARIEQFIPLLSRQLVRRAVATRLFKKGQWTVVPYEKVTEEVFRMSKATRCPAPNPRSTDFRPLAFEAENRPSLVLRARLPNAFTYPEPFAHHLNIPERNARLAHAKWPRIHTQQQNARAKPRILVQVARMCFRRILKRPIHMVHGGGEVKSRRRLCQALNEWAEIGHGAI